MTTQSESTPAKPIFNVIIRENSAYARHVVAVEASTAEEACTAALERIFSADAPTPTVEPLESDTPFVTDVLVDGDDVEFPEKFGELGQAFPDVLELVSEARGIVELIDAFDERCAEAHHTDTGEVWNVLNVIRHKLLQVLPHDDGDAVYGPGEVLMAAIAEGVEQMAAKAPLVSGCLSGVTPCRHQTNDPSTICESCEASHAKLRAAE